jgi:serpin B
MKKMALISIFALVSIATLFPQAFSLGDANEDGAINVIDALVTAQYYVGIKPAHINLALSDVNSDGSTSIVDALLIAQFYVGIITEFPGQATGVGILRSDTEQNTTPALETGELQQLVMGNTTFAADIYRGMASSNDNLIYCPYSISVALAMCYAGAKGATEADIASAMHFTLAQPRLHNAFNALAIELAKPGDSTNQGQRFTLKIINSIWGQRNYPFVQEYLDTLAFNYGACLNILDLKASPENSRITINNWVSDNTEQKIPELLPQGSITTDARLVLTNAIYMKASWVSPFKVADTVPGTFTLLDGTTKTVQMMHKTNSHLNYQNGVEVSGEYQAVSIPFLGSKYAMVFILPASGKFKSFEGTLNGEFLYSLLGSLRVRKITISMPKFKIERGGSIRSLLQGLGMNAPFSAADFTGIAVNTGEPPLVLADVFHNSFINVNEEGVEAAAATGAIMVAPSDPEPMTIVLNRPFVFLITERTTKTVLFAGRVLNP